MWGADMPLLNNLRVYGNKRERSWLRSSPGVALARVCTVNRS